MPIHDWSKVNSGLFHDFHQAWTISIRDALNGGGLPPDFFALTDQITGGPIPDVVTLQTKKRSLSGNANEGGVALAEAPPMARFKRVAPPDRYAGKSNRIVIHHSLGNVVAVIEIVSPGNKSSVHAMRSFIDKADQLLRAGVNLLVVDLFPPTTRDPQGLHKVIWDCFEEEPFQLPSDKQLTVAAYVGGDFKQAYVDPVAVGDELPSLPIFLDPRRYVPAPLEATYQTTWWKLPAVVREVVEHPEEKSQDA